ncbi:MAG: peptidylprolyl isomerase [Candidatus Eiseniibacteriota bacterium]
MAHTFARGLVGAAAALALTGCGGGGGAKNDQDKVVAKSGDVVVTLAGFHDAYNKITPNFRPDITTLEGRRGFASDLVNRGILLAEGERMGGITDPAILTAIDQNRDGNMLTVLYRQEVEAKVEVLGQEVADIHEKRKVNVKMQHILVEDTATASRIREEITSGKISFEDAARKYSLDRNSSKQGGALGEVLWSLNLPSFQVKAFELEPGTVSEPIESDIGVHLVRVTERVQPELATLEELRPALRADVRKQKEAIRMREYVAELEAKAGLTWNDAGLEQLLDLIEEESKEDIDTIPAERQYMPRPTDEQRAVELARFDGRAWTIGDFENAYAQQPPQFRLASRVPLKGLRELIRTTQLQTEILKKEALARGLDKDEEIQSKRDRLYEQILIEQVHNRFVQAADVPVEEVRAMYDSVMTVSPETMTVPERVDMVVLVHTDVDVVEEGLRRIRAGEPEETVISELTLDFRTKAKGGRTGLIARGNYSPQIEDEAFQRRPEQGWSRPIVADSGTGAIRVISREAPRPATFEELKDQLTQSLATARGEAAFEEWLKQERDERGVEIHDEVLQLIGQPVS